VTVPEEFHPLTASTAVAFVSTLGCRGEPQTTPLWFLFRDGRVHVSLERAVAEKYTGAHTDVEPPGTPRYATSVLVEKITAQRGHPA
jgi:hypothetical protein